MNCQAVERVAIDRCDQLLVFAVRHSVMCPRQLQVTVQEAETTMLALLRMKHLYSVFLV